MAHCIGCKLDKNFDEFYKDSSRSTGLSSRCRICTSLYQQDYNKRHSVIKTKRATEWNKANRVRRNDRNRFRAQNDIDFRLAKNLRSRLGHAIRTDARQGSAVKDLGCSIQDFKVWLEKQFCEGMSWDNYGDWHIDHIKPLNSFDLTNLSELKEACNFKNLRPLWAHDNLRRQRIWR